MKDNYSLNKWVGLFFFCIMLPGISFLSTGHSTETGETPRVVGVTEGSFYTDYVQAYWYPRDSVATLAKDGTAPVSISFGQKIIDDGVYQLVAWHPNTPQIQKIIHFTIIKDDRTITEHI